MTDRPIIFSEPMVRALLAGRKTQTRRVLKPGRFAKQRGYEHLRLDVLDGHLWWWDGVHDRVGVSQPFPYDPGDRLWVREAWARVDDNADDIHACPDLRVWAYYCADAGCPEHLRWRSPIFMPRWASRLTLTVSDVRVQRVQDITEADAKAEGVDAVTMEDLHRQAAMSRRGDFAAIWNSLHGPASWDANPWVCALTFTVQRGNIDAVAP